MNIYPKPSKEVGMGPMENRYLRKKQYRVVHLVTDGTKSSYRKTSRRQCTVGRRPTTYTDKSSSSQTQGKSI